MHKAKWKAFSLLLFLSSPGFGELNKTYPTSPVATLRLEAYHDGFKTIALSTWTVRPSSWVPMISTWTWINPGMVTGYVNVVENSSWTVKEASWTIEAYSKMLIEATKQQMINEITDDGVEIYMVFPTTAPTKGWGGWCGQIINGRLVAVACP